MQRDPTWPAAEDLTRAQLAIFRGLGDEISLTEDDRRRVLDLDDRTWQTWTDFLADGALPPKPPLPEMLRRLGGAAFYLSVVVERRRNAAYTSV